VLFAGALLILSEELPYSGNLGRFLFYGLSGAAFAWVWTEGIRTTSDALSEERRQGTLGLLFLTDLKGYDVVLGKLAAHALNSLYPLLAVFPPLALALVLGGVTLGEVGRMSLLLLSTLVLSLSLGMLVSSISRDERKAWLATLLGILLLTILPVTGAALKPGGFLDWGVALISPLTAWELASEKSYGAGSGGVRFWLSLVGMYLVSGSCLGVASLILPRTLHREPNRSEGQARQRNSGWHLLVEGQPWELDRDPVAWLVRRDTVRLSWVFLLLLGLALAVFAWWVITGFRIGVSLMAWAMLLNLIMACLAALQAVHAVQVLRESGYLELLLATPLSSEGIVQGCGRGLWWPMFRWVLPVALVELFVWWGVFDTDQWLDRKDRSIVMIFFFSLLAISLFDVVTCIWMGMWFGLKSPKPGRAVAWVILYVMILPLLASFCFFMFWPILGVVKDLVLLHLAREGVRAWLHRASIDRLAGTSGWEDRARLATNPPQLV